MVIIAVDCIDIRQRNRADRRHIVVSVPKAFERGHRSSDTSAAFRMVPVEFDHRGPHDIVAIHDFRRAV